MAGDSLSVWLASMEAAQRGRFPLHGVLEMEGRRVVIDEKTVEMYVEMLAERAITLLADSREHPLDTRWERGFRVAIVLMLGLGGAAATAIALAGDPVAALTAHARRMDRG